MSSPATHPLVQQQGRTTSSSSSSSGVCARVKMYSGKPYRRTEMGSTLAAKSLAPPVQMQPQLWINFSLNDTEGSPLEKLCSGESQHDGVEVDPTESPVSRPDHREEGVLDSTKKPEHLAGLKKAGCKGEPSQEECMINSPERSEVTEDVPHLYSASSRRSKGAKRSGDDMETGMSAKLQEHVQTAPTKDTLETCTNMLLRLRNHKFGSSFSRARLLQHQAGRVECVSVAGDAPLDLSVVQKRLTRGCYAHPVLFADDVRAVFKAVLACGSDSTPNDLQEQALTLWRLFEEDVALHGIAAPELVTGRSRASLQSILHEQQKQQQQGQAPPVVQQDCLQRESVEQAGTAALTFCTAGVEAEALVAEAGGKGRHGSSSPGGSPRVSSSGCGGDVSRSAWSTDVSGITSWSPVWGGEREEGEEHQEGEQDTIQGILQLSAGPESLDLGGALASPKAVDGENLLCPDVDSGGAQGGIKRPRSKGKSQKKRSFEAVSNAEDAEDGTGSETEEASLPLSTLLAHRAQLRPEAKASGALGAVKAESGEESRKKPRKQAVPGSPAHVAALPATEAAADAPPGVVALEGSPQELAALEVLSGLLCSSENHVVPDEGSARGGARVAALKTTLAMPAATAPGPKGSSGPGSSGVAVANFGDGAAASVLASLASFSREGSLTQESSDSLLEGLEMKPLVHSLAGHPSLVHKVLRKQCPALPGLLLVSECGVAGHGPSSARSTTSNRSSRGKGPAGKRARGGGFTVPSGLGSPSCSCAEGGLDGLCSLSPAGTPSAATSGWVPAAGPVRRARAATPGELPAPAGGNSGNNLHSPGLRSARTHLSAESVSSRRSMPAIPGCTAPVPRPMGPLDSPDHNYGFGPREVSPELGVEQLGLACQGLERGLQSAAASGGDWGLMTQAELSSLLARGLDRKQEGIHVLVHGQDVPSSSTTPCGRSARTVVVPQQQVEIGEESHDGQCARTRGYWWDRASRPRRVASVTSDVALAAAAAGSNFSDAVLGSNPKGFVSPSGFARLASGAHLPSAGILPEALTAAASMPGLWNPPAFQLPEVSIQRGVVAIGIPKVRPEETAGESGCARTSKPFCWAAHVTKSKKRLTAAGPFPGFYGVPAGAPMDCEAAAAAAAVLGLRGGSADGSLGSNGVPAGSSGAALAQAKKVAPLAPSLLHSVHQSLPISQAHSRPSPQPRVLVPQRSSAGSADVRAPTPLLTGGAPAGARLPLEGLGMGGKPQASGMGHLCATAGEGAPTKIMASRKPPISTYGAGHLGGSQPSGGTPAAPSPLLPGLGVPAAQFLAAPGTPAVASGVASNGTLKTSAPCSSLNKGFPTM